MKKYLLLLLAIFSFNAYAIVGATKGSADVSQGNFTYNVEILTPKGVAGLKPELKINYNSSNNVNSILGVGFSLIGVDSITKCNETLFSEKQDPSRNYNYCLNGQKLLLVDDTQEYGSKDSEYKTELNNHQKIIKTATSWLVYSKDGLIKEFGNTTDSNDGDTFYKLNKISDRYGNTIDYIYATDNDHRFIKQIKYSNNTIDFIYEDRTDAKKLASNGIFLNIDQRLKRISIKTANQEVSSYEINYDQNEIFSRITDITECANGECLEPIVFNWNTLNFNFNDTHQWYSSAASGLANWNIYAQDMNGDGLPDLVQTYKGASGHRFNVSLNDGEALKIISLSNGKDQELNIEYSTLQDSDIYTPYTDSTYPELDIKQSPMSVVKSFKVADEVGGFNTTTFKYEGFKIDRQRGSLGFAKIETFNDITNTKSVTEFHQDFPFVGISKSTKSYLNTTLISEDSSVITYSSYFTNPDILNLEITRTEKKQYDINGNYLLSNITLNSGFDKYGNISNIQTITKNNAEQYSKITQSVYTNDENKWILSRLTNAQVTHVHADGSTMQKSSAFVYDSDKGTLVAEIIEPGSAKQLSKSYQYDAHGNKILETVSGTGVEPRSTKYLYDSEGKNIIKIVNALGHTELREYDINNQLTKVTGPNGLSTSFNYDAMGRKVLELRADGTSTTWMHSWDNSIPNSMFKVVQKSTGSPEQVVYFDRASKKLRTVTIGFDGSKIFEDTFYDSLGRVVKISTPHYAIDAPEYIYNTYDALGRVVEADRPGANGNRIIETHVYDGLNITTTNAKGQTKTVQNNIIGKTIKVIEGPSFIEYKYDAFGNLIQTTDSNGNTISLTYDLFGNKIGMDDPDMGVWSYEYNVLGQLVQQTDAKGQVTTMTYDLLGRMIKRVENEGETTWTYDRSTKGIGKLSYVQNANYRKELYYDDLGRVNSTKEFIDANIFTTSLVYNNEGKLEKTIRPDGTIVVNEFNEQGYLQAVKSPKNDVNSPYTYDEIKSAIEESLNVSMEFAQEAVEYSNQAEEKQAKANLFITLANRTTDATLKAQLNETASLATQAALLLKSSSTDAQEGSLKALNRVNYFLNMAKKYQDADFYKYVAAQFKTQTRFYVDMAFTNLNQAISSVDTLVAGTITDDAYLTQETEMIDAYIAQTQSLLVAAQGLSQKVVNYKQKYQDALLKAETQNSSTYLDMLNDTEYTYYYKVLQADEFGRVTKDIVGNGLVTTKEYNKANGHLNYITTGYNGDNDVRDISYTFDDMNNVISTTDAKQNITSNYTYDELNRISTANITGDNLAKYINYTYDDLGNIINKSDVGSYAYQKAHQVVAAGSHTYEYDLNGNVIKKDDTTITYSSYNKPIEIQNAQHTTNFFYAPNRSRYKKTLDGGVTYYVGKLFEKEVTGSKVMYKNFIYAGNELIAINVEEDDGTFLVPSVKYLHKDALDSIDTITSESGEVLQRMVYKPFGERIIGDWINQVDNAMSITKRGFTGHEHIPEFDLIHMNGRVYDPIIGRFLSADPYIQAPYDTQSYNRYSYVKNNPMKYTDPSGFSWFSKVFGGAINFIKKNIRAIVAIVVAVVITYVTLGAASPYMAAWLSTFGGNAFAATVATGAIAGAASGAIMTGTLKGTLQGAVFGGLSAGVAFGVAEATSSMFDISSEAAHSASFLNSESSMAVAGTKAVMHGITRAIITKAQGGSFRAGFWSGFASSGFAAPKNMGRLLGTITTAIVGGTVSEISGGNFANGAATGAFIYLFNHLVLENTTAVSGYHRRISVYDGDGKRLYGISFGLNPGESKFGGQGTVYPDLKDFSTKIVNILYTTPAEDLKMISYMQSQVGKTYSYNLITHNCRDYSSDQFNYINTSILGR